jgi:predicted dehydrogenase
MLKIGLIGCGKITEVRHAPEYFENPNCEITAYFNPTRAKAEKLADLYGGKIYDSVEELLASDVDAVSVCVPNKSHDSVSIQALNAGKHVLCEKPMAITLEGCEAMLEAAKKSGKILMIGLNQRFAKAHVKGREIFRSGELGNLVAFETHFSHPGPEGWTGKADSWFFEKKTAAFGAMADLGVHKTDLLYYLTGKDIVRTFACLATTDKKFSDGRPIEVDDNAMAIYTNEDGVIGTMHAGWTNYGQENNSTKLYCQGGVIRMYDDPEYSLIVERKDGEVQKFDLDRLTSNKDQTSGGRTSTGVIDSFVDSILAGKEPEASGESAIHAMRVIFANQESAIECRPVDIKY